MRGNIFIISILIILQISCKKETTEIEPEIEVFDAGFGKNGFLTAEKSHTDNHSKTWKGSSDCIISEFNGEKYLSIVALTYTCLENECFIVRESLGISQIPAKVGVYQVHSYDENHPKKTCSLYARLISDGCTLGASYMPDESKINTITIEEIDLVNKTVKGSFNVSYIIKEEIVKGYAQKVAFKNGHFNISIGQ